MRYKFKPALGEVQEWFEPEAHQPLAENWLVKVCLQCMFYGVTKFKNVMLVVVQILRLDLYNIIMVKVNSQRVVFLGLKFILKCTIHIPKQEKEKYS
jgi:hypothetical protein